MTRSGHGALSRRTDRDTIKNPFEEIGDTGLERYGGRVAEEFVSNLQGRRAAKTYREMRDNCAVIGSIFFAAEQFIVNNGFSFTPYDDSPNAVLQAEHAEQCFADMEHSASEFLAEAISCSVYGYALLEKVYKRRRGDHPLPQLRSKHNDGRVGIRKLPIRAQDTIEEWYFTPHGETTYAIQQAPPTYKVVKLWMEEVLHIRTTSTKNNPQGRSWLRNAYRSWWFLKHHQEYEGIGASKDMAGVPLGRAPESYFSAGSATNEGKAFTQAKKVLARMQRGEQEYVLWPAAEGPEGRTGWELGLMQSGGRRPMDLDGIIRRYESRILVSVLAEAVLLGQQGNVGSWSLASTQSHMFAVALGGLQRVIAEAVNTQLLPELAVLNGWPPQLAPTMVFADLEAEDMIAKIGALSQAVQSGLLVPDAAIENELRERLGFDARETQPDVSDLELQDALGGLGEEAQG